ncbi:MAG: LysM peptidoglycan-binding domain-containing protein [Sedimentisphaerales bacterium]|nr:LysM peptidoglycan-binding domain-containing protein [Sedimentisphaerales bacterium]
MVQKDLKIGLILGLLLVGIVVFKLATDPRLNPTARIIHLQNVTARDETAATDDDVLNGITPENPPIQPIYTELQENESALIDSAQNEPMPDMPDIPNTENEQLTTVEENSEPTDGLQYMQTEKIKTQRFHIVRKNQNLSVISRQYYGSSNNWHKIVDANRDVIKDPNKLQPGMKLIIPD